MIKLNNHNIRVVFTDIDGVWTDGGMFYNDEGEAFKKFNTSDSAGVLFLRKLNILLVVITGEDSDSVKRRTEKLKIKFVLSGVKNKFKAAQDFCKKHRIDLAEEAAFIGNDFNDLHLLKNTAHSAVPIDAPDYIKNKVDLVLSKKGGEGVFREYIEYLISENMDLGNFVEEHFVKQ
ncbi:KdsC family phosphatase [Aequorivita capsosiphonis]|uniref:KdsC family phosphatase n=1 Tax=Aequorivita capsosiphonis TaxID=487317 RepID=UPI0004276C80|nr:HAD hydrolase family protein [Aequorivita capsosiphonis]